MALRAPISRAPRAALPASAGRSRLRRPCAIGAPVTTTATSNNDTQQEDTNRREAVKKTLHVCPLCGNTGHTSARCPSRSKKSPARRADSYSPEQLRKMLCFRCGQKGHHISQCPDSGDSDESREGSEQVRLCWICRRPGHAHGQCPENPQVCLFRSSFDSPCHPCSFLFFIASVRLFLFPLRTLRRSHKTSRAAAGIPGGSSEQEAADSGDLTTADCKGHIHLVLGDMPVELRTTTLTRFFGAKRRFALCFRTRIDEAIRSFSGRCLGAFWSLGHVYVNVYFCLVPRTISDERPPCVLGKIF
jgi:Zinc knuckle